MYYSIDCGNCQVANCTKDLVKKLLKLVILPKKAAGTHVEDAPHFRQNAQSHPCDLGWLIRPFYFGRIFSLSHSLLNSNAIPQYDTGLVRFVWQKPIARERHWHWDGVDRLDPSRAVGAVAPLLTPPWRNKPSAYPRYGLLHQLRQADERGRTLADWSVPHTQERT